MCIRDSYYIHHNKVGTTLDKRMANVRQFRRQNNRKEIDTFYNLSDSRFEPIEKSPQNLTNVRKVTGLNFAGYKRREELFPETDQATFYDANKEATMKTLAKGNLPWNRMTNRTVVHPVQHETPEDSFDHMKAIEMKTVKMKPRTIALSDFNRSKARDDIMMKTSDAFTNVLLENTREERELEIQARKEHHKKYLDTGML